MQYYYVQHIIVPTNLVLTQETTPSTWNKLKLFPEGDTYIRLYVTRKEAERMLLQHNSDYKKNTTRSFFNYIILELSEKVLDSLKEISSVQNQNMANNKQPPTIYGKIDDVLDFEANVTELIIPFECEILKHWQLAQSDKRGLEFISLSNLQRENNEYYINTVPERCFNNNNNDNYNDPENCFQNGKICGIF